MLEYSLCASLLHLKDFLSLHLVLMTLWKSHQYLNILEVWITKTDLKNTYALGNRSSKTCKTFKLYIGCFALIRLLTNCSDYNVPERLSGSRDFFIYFIFRKQPSWLSLGFDWLNWQKQAERKCEIWKEGFWTNSRHRDNVRREFVWDVEFRKQPEWISCHSRQVITVTVRRKRRV